MQFKKTYLVFFIAAISFFIFAFGCGGKGSGEFATYSPSVAPTPPPAPPSGDSATNAAYFYVGLASTNTMIAYTHKSTGFSDSCAIEKDSATSQDISCIMEVPEGELYSKDLSIYYNVPAGETCRYLVREPYWFYNEEVGLGPADIQVTVIQSTDPTATTMSCVVDGGAPDADCDGHPEIVTRLETNDILSAACVYNRSGRVNATTGYKYNNCCLGSVTINQNTTSPSGDVTNTESLSYWTPPGNVKNCIGGSARTSWPFFDGTTGMPRPALTSAAEGLSETFTISSPISSNLSSNRNVANYYDPVLNSHTGFVSGATSTAPFFVNPVDDRSGTLAGSSAFFPAANDAYVFKCYDAAMELKHRIRLYVREWDTYANYTSFITSKGLAGTPDSTGVDGTNCSGMGDGGFGSNCNDFRDLDDFLILNLGLPSYDTSGPLTTRRSYFPEEFYTSQ